MCQCASEEASLPRQQDRAPEQRSRCTRHASILASRAAARLSSHWPTRFLARWNHFVSSFFRRPSSNGLRRASRRAPAKCCGHRCQPVLVARLLLLPTRRCANLRFKSVEHAVSRTYSLTPSPASQPVWSSAVCRSGGYHHQGAGCVSSDRKVTCAGPGARGSHHITRPRGKPSTLRCAVWLADCHASTDATTMVSSSVCPSRVVTVHAISKCRFRGSRPLAYLRCWRASPCEARLGEMITRLCGLLRKIILDSISCDWTKARFFCFSLTCLTTTYRRGRSWSVNPRFQAR